MKFGGQYPSNWAGYTFLQPRTPEGKPNLRHIGVDYNGTGPGNSDLGLDVLCIAHGFVEKVIKWNGKGGYGNHVFVKHELSQKLKDKYGEVIYSHYAHLNDIVCTQGQDIDQGMLIGHVGKSGTQYAHLHLEIKKPTGLGYESYPSDKPETWLKQYYFDPYYFIEENKISVDDEDLTDLFECNRQLKEEIKKKDETWQWGKDLESELEGAKSSIVSHEDFQKQVAITLKINNQPSDILGEIMRLMTLEDQLRQAQKSLEDKTSEALLNAQERDEFKGKHEESEKARQAVEGALSEANKALEALNKRISELEKVNSMEFTKLFGPVYLGKPRG